MNLKKYYHKYVEIIMNTNCKNCKRCGMFFSKENYLKHKKEKPLYCVNAPLIKRNCLICGKSIKSSKAENIHLNKCLKMRDCNNINSSKNNVESIVEYMLKFLINLSKKIVNNDFNLNLENYFEDEEDEKDEEEKEVEEKEEEVESSDSEDDEDDEEDEEKEVEEEVESSDSEDDEEEVEEKEVEEKEDEEEVEETKDEIFNYLSKNKTKIIFNKKYIDSFKHNSEIIENIINLPFSIIQLKQNIKKMRENLDFELYKTNLDNIIIGINAFSKQKSDNILYIKKIEKYLNEKIFSKIDSRFCFRNFKGSLKALNNTEIREIVKLKINKKNYYDNNEMFAENCIEKLKTYKFACSDIRDLLPEIFYKNELKYAYNTQLSSFYEKVIDDDNKINWREDYKLLGFTSKICSQMIIYGTQLFKKLYIKEIGEADFREDFSLISNGIRNDLDQIICNLFILSDGEKIGTELEEIVRKNNTKKVMFTREETVKRDFQLFIKKQNGYETIDKMSIVTDLFTYLMNVQEKEKFIKKYNEYTDEE